MLWLILLVVVGAIFFFVSNSLKGSKETIDVRGKSVFISGCDTGFGHELAVRLDKKGMRVFAGCISEKGVNELRAKCSAEFHPIICDVTNPEHIATISNILQSSCPEGLYALVNNAGVCIPGEWDWYPEKHLRKIMEVNFFGHVSVTKALLPLLKKSKGRIVNLTSLAGAIAISRMGAYCCSKFAMEAFTDSLRREMRKWGITVYVVEPGYTKTPMVNNINAVIQRVWDETSDEVKREYGAEYGQKVTKLITPKVPLDEPELVVDVLESKITLKYPPLRTRVGFLAKVLYFLTTYLPTSWCDWYVEKDHDFFPAATDKKRK